MPRPRFQRLTDAQREHILDVASAAFAAEGFERTSYNELLQRLGLTKGSAYHTFDGKADLYSVVIERAVTRFAAALPAPACSSSTATSFWPGVSSWLDASLAYVTAHPESARLLGGIVEGDHSGSAAAVAPLMAPFGVLVREGQRVGCVRSDLNEALLVSLCLAVLGALDRVTLPQVSALSSTERGAVLERSIDILRRVLRPWP